MSALYAVAVTAGRDTNGNTRRAIVIYDGGAVVAVVDGDGDQIAMLGDRQSLTRSDAVNTDDPLKITPAYYRELIAGKHTMTRRLA